MCYMSGPRVAPPLKMEIKIGYPPKFEIKENGDTTIKNTIEIGNAEYVHFKSLIDTSGTENTSDSKI